jgi:hypothetical protein
MCLVLLESFWNISFACPKKKLEKKFKKSSHVLLKQQTTSFWLQGILGVKQSFYIVVENDNKLLNYQKPIKVKLLNCYKYLKSQLIQVEVLMVWSKIIEV